MSDSIASPVAYIDATGIHTYSYDQVLAYFVSKYQGIYGADVYLENDSQDGQFLAMQALAVHQANNLAVAAYNAFSPSTAVGVGLSSVVKINGIARSVPTNGTVDMTSYGDVGKQIINGIVQDDSNNQWAFPPVVTIGLDGSVIATATAVKQGTILGPAGTITSIANPQNGWVSVINASDAEPGAPLEGDPALQERQAVSAALPSLSVEMGLEAALDALPGVTRQRIYENDTHTTDTNNLPGNAIAVVIEGGDAQSIANTIRLKKGQGCLCFGTTVLNTVDAYGIPRSVGFTRPGEVLISMTVQVRPLAGYTASMGTDMQNDIADYGTTYLRIIGQDVEVTQLYGAPPRNRAYNVLRIILSRVGGSVDSYGNAPIEWDEIPNFLASAIVIQTVS